MMSGINLSARVWNAIREELDKNGYEIKKKKLKELKQKGEL